MRQVGPSSCLALLVPFALLFAYGPDAGGYRWQDSDSGGPAFNWIDISGSGTRLQMGDDDNQGPFALGFRFGFYQAARESVRICSNGWLSFTSNSHQFHHYPLPTTAAPNSVVAPLWADLDPSAEGAVLYRSDPGSGQFVVTWLDVPFHGRTGRSTFQVVLDSSGSIVFQYLAVAQAEAESCAVGIENDSGTVGLEYFCDARPGANRLHDSLAVRWYRLRFDVTPVQFHQPFEHVLSGVPVIPLVRIWNPGLEPASFPVSLGIGSGYSERIDISDLASLDDTLLAFPAWTAEPETTQLVAAVSLAGDECPQNDTLRFSTVGSLTGEIRYDDGVCDSWYFRSGAPNRDYAVATKFTLPCPTARLLGGALFMGDTQRFSRILICRGDTAGPDTLATLVRTDSVAAPGPGTWLRVPADTQVTSESELWLLAFLCRNASGPSVGLDRTRPIDARSYFCAPGVARLPITAGDLMIRLAIDVRAGAEEPKRPRPSGSRVLAPTIVRGVLFLPGSLPGAHRSLLSAAGRKVLELRTGANDVRQLAPGVYFVQQEGPQGRGFERGGHKVVVAQ